MDATASVHLGKSATETLAMIRKRLGGMFDSGQTEEGETDEEQSQEHVQHFLRHQECCSEIIPPVGQTVNSAHYYDILRRNSKSKLAKTSSRTLEAKELAVTSRQRTHRLTLPLSPQNF
jgi:hypothetical protein